MTVERPCVLMSNTSGYLTEALALISRRWDMVVCPTDAYATRVRTATGLPTKVIPYGFDAEALDTLLSLQPPDWNDAVTTVWLPHRPDPRKGQLQFLQTLDADSPLLVKLTWLDHETHRSAYRDKLEQTISERGLDSIVEFVPWASGNDRWQTVRQTHCVVQVGTFEETFGLSMFEAALGGRIVVTCRQPAIDEVLHGAPHHGSITSSTDWQNELDRLKKAYVADEVDEWRQGAASRMTIASTVAQYAEVLDSIGR